jgi:hypothetical protein
VAQISFSEKFFRKLANSDFEIEFFFFKLSLTKIFSHQSFSVKNQELKDIFLELTEANFTIKSTDNI